MFITATGTTSTMAVAWGFVFIFFGFGNVKVYGFNQKGKRVLLCNVFISKEGKVKIPKYRLKKNCANSIIVKPNARVLKRKKGEMLSIHLGNDSFSKAIQKEISLTY